MQNAETMKEEHKRAKRTEGGGKRKRKCRILSVIM
jgi:hypothetical protein